VTDVAPLAPSRTALLLMDIQPAIVDGLPGADALLDRLVRARAAARAHGVQVVHVRVALTEEDARVVPPANRRFHQTATTRRLAVGEPATWIHPALAPADDEHVVRKVRVGAFSTTGLDAWLRAHDIDTLVLTGVATSGVVLSTVRDAADKDYRLLVVADCCADRDDEVHRVLTQKVFPSQADVLGLDAFTALLG